MLLLNTLQQFASELRLKLKLKLTCNAPAFFGLDAEICFIHYKSAVETMMLYICT